MLELSILLNLALSKEVSMEMRDTIASILQSVDAHASWANGKLFDTAAQISEAQLTGATGGSDTIFDLLLHLVEVQRVWLAPHTASVHCSFSGSGDPC